MVQNYRTTNAIFFGAAAQRGPLPPHSWGFWITHNDAPQSVGLLWASDQLVAETSTWQHTTLTTDSISAGERPQTYALDREATGTGLQTPIVVKFSHKERIMRFVRWLVHTKNVR